jgi:hypothetical protein
MDFSNRSAQPQTAAPSAHVASAAPNGKKSKSDNNMWSRVGAVVTVALFAIILIALTFVIAGGNPPKSESTYVDTSKLQAVFLSTGQVYFGNVKTLNPSYLVLGNIYYLQTSSTGSTANASTNVSLVKLGCELHEPYDQMVINRSQVTFWENLQDNGQVAKAVASFEKANPNGQKCADQSTSSGTTSGSTVQNAGTSSTSKP